MTGIHVWLTETGQLFVRANDRIVFSTDPGWGTWIVYGVGLSVLLTAAAGFLWGVRRLGRT